MTLPIDAFPDISPTQVKIILKAPGMTPEEIEAQITLAVETELLGIPNQEILRSMTKYAITDITLDFTEGTDIYWARQQVAERLANVLPSLPDSVEGGIAPMSTPLSEMFMFSLESDELSLTERRQILEWEIRPLLRSIDGVADVNILGGFAKTFQISPNPVALSAIGLSFSDLIVKVKSSNANGTIGRADIGNDTLIVRAEGRFNSIDDLKEMVVSNEVGTLRLRDVAKVSEGHLTRYGAVTRNGNETAQAIVIALKNANTANVIEQVRQKLASIEKTLPEHAHINVFYDRKVLIDKTVGTIKEALFLAVILVIIILTVFLGDLRAAITVSMILPFSAASTFLLMEQFDITANLMSLGGLVIAIGMLVDASVVVVENAVTMTQRNTSLPKLHLIYRACKDVAVPVVSGTVIVIIVFSPLLTLSGLEGKLFAPVAITIVFAMISSLILSLTLIPALCSLLLKQEMKNEPSSMRWLKAKYEKMLMHVFVHSKSLMALALCILTLSLLLFAFLGKTFMPSLDEGDIIVQLEKSPSISLESSTKLDIQIQEALLAKIPEIRQIVARVGSDEIGLDPMSLNETDIFMELKEESEWEYENKASLIAAIRSIVASYPGLNFGFTQPIQMRVSEMLTGNTSAVSIKVFGNDIQVLAELASKIKRVVEDVKGSQDVNTSIIEGGRFLTIRLHPEMASQIGMNTSDLSAYLRAYLDSVQVSTFIEGKVKTPIVLSRAKNISWKPASINDVNQMPILLPDGQLLPLHTIADISIKQGPIQIERENSNRFSVVTSNVAERDVVSFVEDLQEAIDKEIDLPLGYLISFGGEYESQQRATENLLMVVPISLLLITIILFSTFGSLLKAVLVLCNIPFAVMGGVIALFFSGEFLSVPASVGFIALLGIAVLNGVVMIAHFEQSHMHTRQLRDRIIDGAKQRLRPVLMTALTAMFGLAPLAFATGPGAEVQKPLAIVVIGGLFTSTFTTLFLLPIFYSWLEQKNAD